MPFNDVHDALAWQTIELINWYPSSDRSAASNRGVKRGGNLHESLHRKSEKEKLDRSHYIARIRSWHPRLKNTIGRCSMHNVCMCLYLQPSTPRKSVHSKAGNLINLLLNFGREKKQWKRENYIRARDSMSSLGFTSFISASAQNLLTSVRTQAPLVTSLSLSLSLSSSLYIRFLSSEKEITHASALHVYGAA